MSGAGLWLLAVVVMLWAGFSNTGRTRWFWFLMAFGAALVATNFVGWLYYEVITGRQTPNPFWADIDRKSTRLNSSHSQISYAVFCLKKKIKIVNSISS